MEWNEHCESLREPLWEAQVKNRISDDLSTCIVCESLAWPKISNKAGSETKKKRGNNSRFFSK